MRKTTIIKPLRLAGDADSWREMDATIGEAVDKICGQYDDQDLTEKFLFLIDLLTNREYDANDREMAAYHCQRAAFKYTSEFEQAQEAYLNRINPGRAQLAKAS